MMADRRFAQVSAAAPREPSLIGLPFHKGRSALTNMTGLVSNIEPFAVCLSRV